MAVDRGGELAEEHDRDEQWEDYASDSQ